MHIFSKNNPFISRGAYILNDLYNALTGQNMRKAENYMFLCLSYTIR